MRVVLRKFGSGMTLAVVGARKKHPLKLHAIQFDFALKKKVVSEFSECRVKAKRKLDALPSSASPPFLFTSGKSEYKYPTKETRPCE